MNDLMLPLDDAELDELDHFLLNHGYDKPEAVFDSAVEEGVLDISELDGFLAAIVSGPVSVLPSRWLAALWGDVRPQWKTEKTFERIIGLLMRHMNGIANSLLDPEFEFEPLFLEREVEGRRYTIVDEWCVGYLRGVALTQAQWDEAGEVIQELLAPITLFGEEAGWQRLKGMSLDEVELWQARVPSAARNIYAYWLLQREDRRPQAVVKEGPRIGRNDPCPCGSGKKYKKCCLH